MREVQRLTLVAAGAVVGALVRYGIALAFGDSLSPIPDQNASFPWSTIVVNLAGAFVIGFIALLIDRSRQGTGHFAHPLLITGFLGGFTTFSALALDSVGLLESGAWVNAAAYLAVTFIGGIALVFVGERLGKVVTNRATRA